VFCRLLQPELDYTSGWGGAVAVSTASAVAAVQSVVRNCTFTDNAAPVCCAAMYLNSTATIDGCTFNDNSVVVGAAGALSTHHATTLTNSNFSRNVGYAVSSSRLPSLAVLVQIVNLIHMTNKLSKSAACLSSSEYVQHIYFTSYAGLCSLLCIY
jgi:hypothetical protein